MVLETLLDGDSHSPKMLSPHFFHPIILTLGLAHFPPSGLLVKGDPCKCCPACALGMKSRRGCPIGMLVQSLQVMRNELSPRVAIRSHALCLIPSQAGSPSGLLAVSFDVGQDSLKSELSHFTTCLMGKPSCTSLTLKKDMSHTIEGKGVLSPPLSSKGPGSAPPPMYL